MALVSPVVPRARVLQGTLVLLLALVLGPILSWKLCIMLWPARWTILATVAFAELCFYRCVLCVECVHGVVWCTEARLCNPAGGLGTLCVAAVSGVQ